MSLFQTSLTPITPHFSAAKTRLRRTSTTSFPIAALSAQHSPPEPEPKPKPKPRPKKPKPKPAQNPDPSFPGQVPRKPRRGRRSEAQAVEDYVRSTLERTFAAIREQDPEAFENIPSAIRERKNDDDDGDDDDVEAEAEEEEAVVEEESGEWPVDAEVGWGIRSSEYFEKHPIKNVVGDDGYEIDWEGEIDDNWVKEINCLEWESFVFHPSPIVVLAFERYNRASENWKALKELEKALKVYWESRDRLPPRSVKIDINIEKDLAYALRVQEGPQILFLRGTTIIYREKEFRTADELVQMIAHFYYKAKRPSYVRVSAKS